MITMVQVTNPMGDTISLPLSDYSGGYLVKGIDGLDPVTASVVTSSMAQMDGAQPQSSRRDIRNIVLHLEFKPNAISSVSSLRGNLYSYLMPKMLVTLSFYQDGQLYATTTGTVESFGAPLFSQDPVADISIVCYDPDFYGNLVTVAGVTQSPLFIPTQTITYSGSSDSGVTIQLNISSIISGFTIVNTRPDNTIQNLNIQGQFFTGDVCTVVTTDGQKKIVVVRSGVTSSVLGYLQPNPGWTKLKRGDNQFKVTCATSNIPWTLTYQPKYGGL